MSSVLDKKEKNITTFDDNEEIDDRNRDDDFTR